MVWRINAGRLEVLDPATNKYEDVCEAVCVTHTHTDFITRNKKYEIEVVDSVTGASSIIIPASELRKDVIYKLYDKGLRLMDNIDETSAILEVLWDSVATSAHKITHDALGFVKCGLGEVYFSYNPIGSSDPLAHTSTHIDEELMKPMGTLDSWKKVVHDEILGHTNMELALSLSALAPVSHLLKERKIIKLLPIIALVGNSSIGKTTSLLTLASVFGSPEEGMGLIGDLNSTQNAFFAQLTNNGFPAIFDETSAVPEWDFTKILYNLPKGRSKLRCDGEGNIRKPHLYSGAIFFSGERSLLQQCKSNTWGLNARILELNLPWTENGQHADRIAEGFRNNYGTAVYPMIDWLLKNSNSLVDMYVNTYEEVIKDFPCASGVEDRILKMFALILLSAKIVAQSLNLPLNIAKIKNVLIAFHKENRIFERCTQALVDGINQEILYNLNKFPDNYSDPSHKGVSAWGQFVGKDKLYITVDALDKIVEKLSGKSILEVRKELYECGYLYRSKDRHYVFNRNIQGIYVPCYTIYYYKFYPSATTEQIEQERKEEKEKLEKQRQQKKEKRLEELMKDVPEDIEN